MTEKAFRKGEIIFYPKVGLGEIVEVDKKVMGDEEVDVFKIRIFSNSSEIFVPIDDMKKLNIRHLITKKEIDDLYKLIDDDNFQIEWNWKKRYKFHDQLFLSGKPKDMVLILKNLTYIQKRKDLTKKELKFRDEVLELLAEEIAKVSNRKIENIKKKIEAALNKKVEEKLKEKTK